MSTKYIKALQEMLQTKYPEKQSQTALSIQNVKFKLFLYPSSQLLRSYSNITSLSLTHCDIRNLENFPRFYHLQELDLGYNQIQGTFNNIMPLKRLKYLNVQSNIIFEFMKLAPLRKIVGGNQQKGSFKIAICIRNNPFTKEETSYMSKIKAFGLRVVKQPKQFFDKKKADEEKINNLKNKQELTSSQKKRQLKKRKEKMKGIISLEDSSSSNSSSDLSSLIIDSSDLNSDFEEIEPIIRMNTNNQSDRSNQASRIESSQFNRVRLQRQLNSRLSSYNSRGSSHIEQDRSMLDFRSLMAENINNQGRNGRLLVRLGSSTLSNGQNQIFIRESSAINPLSDFQGIDSINDDQNDEDQENMNRLFGIDENRSEINDNRVSAFLNQMNNVPSILRFDSLGNSSNQSRPNHFLRRQSHQSRNSILRNSISVRERLERTLAENQNQLNRLRQQRQLRQRQTNMQILIQGERVSRRAELQALRNQRQVLRQRERQRQREYTQSRRDLNELQALRREMERQRNRPNPFNQNNNVQNNARNILSVDSPSLEPQGVGRFGRRNHLGSLNNSRTTLNNSGRVRGMNTIQNILGNMSRNNESNINRGSRNNSLYSDPSNQFSIGLSRGSVDHNHSMGSNSNELLFNNIDEQELLQMEQENIENQNQNQDDDEVSEEDDQNDDQNENNQEDELQMQENQEEEHVCDSQCQDQHQAQNIDNQEDQSDENDLPQEIDESAMQMFAAQPQENRMDMFFSGRRQAGQRDSQQFPIYQGLSDVNDNFINQLDFIVERSEQQIHQNIVQSESNQRSQQNQNDQSSSQNHFPL